MDVHFAVSFQYPNPPSRTCAQNGRISSEMAGGGRRRAYDHSEFLYFEERLEKPRVEDFQARWHDGNHRGKATRNLHIFEKATGKKRFSCTLPRNGAKLQPYFDVPDVANGAHIFRPEKADVLPLFVRREDADAIEKLFPDTSSEDVIAQLLENWRKGRE